MRRVPAPSVLLRLLEFMVPCVLALAGVQPLIGAAAGAVGAGWAVRLSVPALVAAAMIFVGGRLLDRGDGVQPPWYSAWLLLPGAFVLAGAGAMCIFGALVELPLITTAMWLLLVGGFALWSGGLLVVRRASR
jgi:hypothetical protein